MSSHTAGALLPVWLLGAPLAIGILERMRTPRSDSRY